MNFIYYLKNTSLIKYYRSGGFGLFTIRQVGFEHSYPLKFQIKIKLNQFLTHEYKHEPTRPTVKIVIFCKSSTRCTKLCTKKL